MSETNDMRREFEVLLVARGASTIRKGDGYGDSLSQSFWVFWQAATERATVLERERCAAQAEKSTKNNRVIVASIDGVPTSACFIATAIRQGGAA